MFDEQTTNSTNTDNVTLFPIEPVASDESTHPVLKQLKDRISELEQSLEKKNESISHYMNLLSAKSNELYTFQNKVRTVLTELYQEDEISRDVAEKFANECDIEVTKTITVSGAVTFSGNVEVSIFQDLDDIRFNVDVNNLDISVYGEDMGYIDSDVEDVEWEDY